MRCTPSVPVMAAVRPLALDLVILGATGHIGRSLMWRLGADDRFRVYAYARRPESVRADLTVSPNIQVEVGHTDSFGQRPFDIVINCIGAGDPARINDLGANLFQITETFDNQILACLQGHPEALYINMSSGAVYGTTITNTLCEHSVMSRRVNDVRPEEWYGIVKRNAEAKHRAHGSLNIVDLRVFSYFSRFLNLDGRLFVVDLVNALLRGAPLMTSADDSIRDYATPADMVRMIMCVIDRWNQVGEGVNGAIDLYTKAPVGKFQLIEAVADRFGLSWNVERDAEIISNTGNKVNYVTGNHKAADWGYEPEFNSCDGILHELGGIAAKP